jgi:cytochrome c oxidase subunit 2
MRDRWATLVFSLASLVLVAVWPGWRLADMPAAYAEPPEAFAARVEAFVAGQPIVRPVPGDVPLLARRFEFHPALELRIGRTYRLHLSSVDGVHALVLDGVEMMLVPGEVRVLDITPDRAGPLEARCNEYCGLGHNRMRGQIVAVE